MALKRFKDLVREGQGFRGLNKTDPVPFPKPKVRQNDMTTFPGYAPDDGRLKEAYEGGGAPNVGNNNYAQNLPAPVNTALKKKQRQVGKDDVSTNGDMYKEDVIMSLEELNLIFEAYVNEDLKVGDNSENDNIDAKKFDAEPEEKPKKKTFKDLRLTATKKKPHEIITSPTIFQQTNPNKTIPSGPQGKGKG